MDRSYEFLLNKYKTKDANEIWTTQHEKEYKQNQRTEQKFHDTHNIFSKHKAT